jgi:hypothetical protein
VKPGSDDIGERPDDDRRDCQPRTGGLELHVDEAETDDDERNGKNAEQGSPDEPSR